MKNLIIIGAGGFGREVHNLACLCKGYNREYRIKGFLDDRTDALEDFNGYSPIIGSIESYEVQIDDVFVCALGNPDYKRKYADIIKSKGGYFIDLISPSAHIGDNCKHGCGLIMFQNAHIGADVTLGDFVTFDGHGAVGHDCKIGNYCHIGAQSSIAGFTIVGENVTIHPGAHITTHRRIGENSTIGIGSIVINHVKAGTTVFGNPAKRIQL